MRDDAWKPRPAGKRGGQRKYSDVTIETALALRRVFSLPLRQAEGFLRSLMGLMRVNLEVPDHTTLSRRSQHLDVRLRRPATNKPMHLIVDGTGLAIGGGGEWAAAKHGKKGKRGWKKESGYHRQGTVENAFYRYDSLIGDRRQARHLDAQRAEAVLACNVLNRMFGVGRPRSRAIRA